MREGAPTIEIFATYISETAMAILINDGNEEDTWVPKSQLVMDEIPDEMEAGEEYNFIMSEWIATEKGLI